MKVVHIRDIRWEDLPGVEDPIIARGRVESGFYNKYGYHSVHNIDEVLRHLDPGGYTQPRNHHTLEQLLDSVAKGDVVLVHRSRHPFRPVLRWQKTPHMPAPPGAATDDARHPDPSRHAATARGIEPGRWIVDPSTPSPLRRRIANLLERGRCDPHLNCGKPEVSWWDWIVGGAKGVVNHFLADQAAAQAEWMADKGIVQYKDRATGEVLTPEAVYNRHRTEGGKLLPPVNAVEARGAKAVGDHAATAAAVSAVTALATHGRSALRHPTQLIDDVKKAVKNSRSESEALGKAGMEQAKERLGHTTDPRYKDRYHGPDDMTRDKDGKLCEWECKGNNDDSTAVAVDSAKDKQGSSAKNARRATTMTEQKSRKVGVPSNRQGGPYTQDEIDLWQDVNDIGGNKAHMSSHTNTETGQVRVYERDHDGNITRKVDDFKLDDYDALKQGVKDEMSKTNGVSK
ncbi:MAG: hypothetical protein HYS20_12715 [Rhodocyclales bacterium]|nr:hypothetical protein [Rhodocyclales bacterium]